MASSFAANGAGAQNGEDCQPIAESRANGPQLLDFEALTLLRLFQLAIGSGGPYALAAAKALANNSDLDARAIAEKAMEIAGEICIYTNTNVVIEEL